MSLYQKIAKDLGGATTFFVLDFDWTLVKPAKDGQIRDDHGNFGMPSHALRVILNIRHLLLLTGRDVDGDYSSLRVLLGGKKIPAIGGLGIELAYGRDGTSRLNAKAALLPEKALRQIRNFAKMHPSIKFDTLPYGCSRVVGARLDCRQIAEGQNPACRLIGPFLRDTFPYQSDQPDVFEYRGGLAQVIPKGISKVNAWIDFIHSPDARRLIPNGARIVAAGDSEQDRHFIEDVIHKRKGIGITVGPALRIKGAYHVDNPDELLSVIAKIEQMNFPLQPIQIPHEKLSGFRRRYLINSYS